MKIATTGAILFFFLLATLPQAESDENPGPTTAIQERDSLAHAINEFGYKLVLNMMKHNKNNNIVISPTGIAGLLAMTLLGSTGNTYDELAKALGFSQDILANRKNHEQFGDLLDELNKIEVVLSKTLDPNADLNTNVTFEDAPNADLNVMSKSFNINSTSKESNNATLSNEDLATRTLYADAVIVDTRAQIRDIYREYLNRVYHGDALTTHFGDTVKSQQLINDWVKNHTNGKIEDFLKEPLPASTKVVLLSALYFSGQWARPFVPEYTMNMTFHKPSGDIFTKLMLNLGDFYYIFKSQYGVHMIAFPYNDSSTTMYVLKPFFHKRVTLEDVMQSLNYSTIDQLIDNMKKEECVVRFPKMDLKSKVDLKESLREIGLQSMFSPKDANFALMMDSGLVVKKKEDVEILSRIYTDDERNSQLKDVVNNLPNPGVYVDSVLHDVKMTIDEYGTLAVAATSGLLARSAKTFHADSPFYMFIRNERTKLITFSAVIFDPTES